ncbi:N-acetyltransferase, partial [Staphylococcus aureus]|nr:N-acetyltransferase [Staphylococcus aureus]
DAPLIVKYLWYNLKDEPHGILKFQEHFY